MCYVKPSQHFLAKHTYASCFYLRHSFTSRLLFTCISSKLYDGEKTLRDLHAEWASQMRALFYDGVQAGVKNDQFKRFQKHAFMISVQINIYLTRLARTSCTLFALEEKAIGLS